MHFYMLYTFETYDSLHFNLSDSVINLNKPFHQFSRVKQFQQVLGTFVFSTLAICISTFSHVPVL